MNTKVIGMLNLPGRLESACRIHDVNYISPTINTVGGGGLEPKIMEENKEIETRREGDKANIRIRKLTPKECWRIRLMGFSDEDFAKAKEVNSDSQLYKQAGNSIVVNVLMAIFKEMM